MGEKRWQDLAARGNERIRRVLKCVVNFVILTSNSNDDIVHKRQK